MVEIDIAIHSVDTSRDIARLKSFLFPLALHYPAYEAWVEAVCLPDIEQGYKHALLASSNGHIVGDAVFQAHKELPRTREIKNMRIHPGFRGRDLGHFLMRQIEVEAPEEYDALICDTDASERGILHFLRFCGFQEIYRAPLYSGNYVDVILVKNKQPGQAHYQ